VRLVLPAGPASPLTVKRAVRRVRDMGFVAVPPRLPRMPRGYLSAPDSVRAAELLDALTDRSARAVVAVRGGTGSMRLLEAVDALDLGDHRPLLVGFSDITALHAVLYARHDLVCLQGPMPGLVGWDARSQQSLARLLTLRSAPGSLAPRRVPWRQLSHARARRRARGVLTGGNLAMVAALAGTPWQVPGRGAILYLEDVDESPHRIERMLLQLRRSGTLDEAEAIVIGTMTACESRDRKPSLTTDEVFADIFGPMRVPVVSGFPAGHAWPTVTVPLGVRAELDVARGTLSVIDPVLSAR
jgi:muramoyltetrapeptide carboxypeptidase